MTKQKWHCEKQSDSRHFMRTHVGIWETCLYEEIVAKRSLSCGEPRSNGEYYRTVQRRLAIIVRLGRSVSIGQRLQPRPVSVT